MKEPAQRWQFTVMDVLHLKPHEAGIFEGTHSEALKELQRRRKKVWLFVHHSFEAT